MMLNWLIATTPEEVGIAWLDFFSIGHITFGIGVFLFFSFFYTIQTHRGITPYFSLLFVYICTFSILIVWEVLENTLFVGLGIKFEGRLDSWQNILTDLVIGNVGGLCTWFFCYQIVEKDKNMKGYYAFGITGFTIWFVFFFILRFLTLH